MAIRLTADFWQEDRDGELQPEAQVPAHRTAGRRRARLAIDIYCYRVRKYIGAYLAAMGGADAVVFTGGVGENAAEVANLSFRDNTSLTAMAVKNRHYLPYRGEFDPGSQVVYTRKAVEVAGDNVAAERARGSD